MSMGFGDMLLNRRRQMGLSIQQVANTIKMRPQIIEYFETGNYEAMPPRGYAQGMISSYARFLGLNPREVVDAYFEGLYAYEHSPNATGPANFTGAMDASPRSANATGRYLMVDTRDAGSRFAQRPPQAGYVPESRSPYEMVPGHRPRAGGEGPRRAPAGPGRSHQVADGRTAAMPPARGRRGPERGAGSLATRDPRGRGRARGSYVGGAPRRGRGGRTSRRGFDLSSVLSDPRLIPVCLGLIALLVIVLVLVLLKGCSGRAAAPAGSPSTPSATAAGSASKPGSSVASGAPAAGSAAITAPQGSTEAEPQPTQYEVAITYTGDATAWVEIRVDGALAPETGRVSKGFSHTYTVTDSIEISTDSTADVEVTRDGHRVRYDSRSSGIGRITIKVPKPAAAATDEAGGEQADASAGGTADTAAADQTATQQ
ncbi:MAG: helix-turn-helix domain-containing protein [Coriobacteriaceae bacterium]|nr:helix-turn-helix domain-containing protein [Coriobacteriaceae bacterium]